MSVITWSLRLRAVCRRRPASPTSSVRRRSTAVWMSSSPSREGERRPPPSRRRSAARPSSIAAASSAGMIPWAPSIRAWAREAAMSCGHRRRLTDSEAFSRSKASAGPGGEAAAPQADGSVMPARTVREGLADAVHLRLGHLREEGQRDRRGADGLGDRELARPVAVLVLVVRLQVDARQVGLGRDAAARRAGR